MGHRLRGIVERYIIIEGKGLVREGDLIFLAICVSRFTMDCYENIDCELAYGEDDAWQESFSGGGKTA
jgi:hypothetical protein